MKYQSEYKINGNNGFNYLGNLNNLNNCNNKINVNINIKDNIIIDSDKTGDKIKNIINHVSGSGTIRNKENTLKIISVSEKLFKTDVSSEENLSENECRSPLTNPLESREKISPNSFLCHALIGKGSFGEVYLVQKKNTKTFYAMKALNKDKIMGIFKIN
jgi:hypothetical protein